MPNKIIIKNTINSFNKKISVSGDKSISIRWVLFSSLANGISTAKKVFDHVPRVPGEKMVTLCQTTQES